MATKNLYFVEFLPRVAAASTTVSSKCSHFTFTRKGIHSTSEGNLKGVQDKNPICGWDNAYELHVTSCSDLVLVPNEGLHVRFRAKCDSRTLGNLLCDELEFYAQNECPLILECGFCRTQITKESHVFKRVLPLPSEAWRELSGDFFCHPVAAHSHTSADDRLSDAGAMKLAPRAGDCLVNESVLLLQSCALNLATVEFKKEAGGFTQRLHCARCLLYLGSTMETVETAGECTGKGVLLESLSLQRSKVKVQTHTNQGASRSMEENLAKRLHSTSKTKMASKLIIQDHAGKQYLLVWMLNVISRIIWNTSPTSENSSLSRFTGDADWSNEGTAADSIVLKLLFRCLTPGDATTGQNCEVLVLTVEECLYLTLILADNNQAIPPSQSKGINGCKVGFMRLPETLT